ncbi:hypothetical protein NQ317_014066 [Molorchus minor]|uniref:Small ribosomal subunit protein mS35 mitochondrial conserved domain-containing protein n=1 Tax=Molorchus minor TaxID=1323400 RepID=A0ABQ9JH74_9CUCU|nr:hypothetical protein NQ317_014066 [Molorchus minor]
MLSLYRNVDRFLIGNIEKQIAACYSTAPDTKSEPKVLNLKFVRGQASAKKTTQETAWLPPRTKQMAVDKDWGNVWLVEGPFTQLLYLFQSDKFTQKRGNTGDNAEALKKFCTPWPKALDTDEKCEKHFPFQVASSDYCHSSPTIRDPLSRIVTVQFKLSTLNLTDRAKDKILRLVDDRYNEETDTVTLKVEPWEETKSEADMEYYDWNKNASKTNIESYFGKPTEEIENIQLYSDTVSNLMNEGESEYTVSKYGEAVKDIKYPNFVTYVLICFTIRSKTN